MEGLRNVGYMKRNLQNFHWNLKQLIENFDDHMCKTPKFYLLILFMHLTCNLCLHFYTPYFRHMCVNNWIVKKKEKKKIF